jgi:acetyl-CoA carboxylase carboxyl transferase subunit beta
MADKTPPKPPQEKRGGWLSRFAPGVRKIVSRRDTPDNLWVKDPDSGDMLYRPDLEAALWVTPSGRHMRINARQRLGYTFDGGVFQPIETPDVPEDPLKFSDGKPYRERLAAARKATGQKDAMAIGYGEVGGASCVVVVQDFTFMGGSLGVLHGRWRRPDAGRRAQPDADGAHDAGGSGTERRGPSLCRGPDRSDDRRGDGVLRHAGRRASG